MKPNARQLDMIIEHVCRVNTSEKTKRALKSVILDSVPTYRAANDNDAPVSSVRYLILSVMAEWDYINQVIEEK